MAELARIHTDDTLTPVPVHEDALGRVENELIEIRERLSRLEQASMGSDPTYSDLLARAIAEIRQRKDALEAKIQGARATAKSISQDLKSGIGLAWEDIKTSLDSATSRFFH